MDNARGATSAALTAGEAALAVGAGRIPAFAQPAGARAGAPGVAVGARAALTLRLGAGETTLAGATASAAARSAGRQIDAAARRLAAGLALSAGATVVAAAIAVAVAALAVLARLGTAVTESHRGVAAQTGSVLIATALLVRGASAH
jgi:hypothetical protein